MTGVPLQPVADHYPHGGVRARW